MYDIEFVIPICSQKHWLQRAIDLSKFQFYNNKNKATLIKLLVNEVDRFPPSVFENWGNGIKIEVVKYDTDSAAAKMAQYFGDLENHTNARWYAKFDDDSLNDISTLVDRLDAMYDWEREYYLVTELREERHPIESKLLHQKIGVKWDNCTHEKEGSVISQGALKQVLNTQNSKKYCQLRGEIYDGWGDIFLAIACKLCKIYAIKAPFLSTNAWFGDITAFGGPIAHLHHFSRDTQPRKFDIWERYLLGEYRPEIWKFLENKEFLFESDRGVIDVFKFMNTGLIKSKHQKANFWAYENDILKIFDFKADIIHSFALKDNKFVDTVPNRRESFYLRTIL